MGIGVGIAMSGRNVVALAGRRVDAPGAPVQFPAANIPAVRERILAMLRTLAPRALVSSAACGADLLAIAAAGELGLRCRIVLPFTPQRFRETSVIDRPGDWAVPYDAAIATARAAGDLVILDAAKRGEELYLHANEAILDEAAALADGGSVVAVVVWDGQPRSGTDVTAAFAASAERRGLRVQQIAIALP